MSIEAFNNLLKSFLEELSKVFPSDPKLKVYSNLFDTIVVASPKLPIDMFMKAFGSEGELINKKDPAIFDKIPVLFGEIQLKQMWESDISDANRGAIFSYLQTLYMLGTTIKSLPESMLVGIEQMAEKLSKEIETPAPSSSTSAVVAGNNQQQQAMPDLGALLSSVTSMLGSGGMQDILAGLMKGQQ